MLDGMLLDSRDRPFLRLMLVCFVTVVASGVLMFVPGVFHWWLAAARMVLVLYFTGPFVLMLHNTSHRRLFKGRWGRLNYVIPWVLGPFFGESPETYFAHHVGMHHPENNVGPDISSTLDYRRDSAFDFFRYLGRFLLLGIFDLSLYLAKKKRRSLMIRTIVGELAFFVLSGVLLYVNWRATLTVFVIPFLLVRFLMMAGNWSQHAFIDSASPANNYRNSITCINTSYNTRCFNDGYHIGHHLKQNRHWTEMPEEFERNRATYAAERAIVFDGIDYFGIWALLMTKQYNALASRVVALGEVTPSIEERVELLKSRTRWKRDSADRENNEDLALVDAE